MMRALLAAAAAVLPLAAANAQGLAVGYEPTLVKDLLPGTFGRAASCSAFVRSGDWIYFSGRDPRGHELWRVHRTTRAVGLVFDLPHQSLDPRDLVDLDGQGSIAFTGNACEDQRELWLSDGTAAGTRVVEVRAGPEGSAPSELVRVGGTVFFGANDGVHGRELWKSDGSVAGTVLVKDIEPQGDGDPVELVAFGGQLLFVAATAQNGAELWRSDGTAAGTVLVADLVAGSGSSRPVELTASGGEVWFGTYAGGLWRTAGTAASTVQVSASLLVNWTTSGATMIDVGGSVFVSGSDGVNRGVWHAAPSGLRLVQAFTSAPHQLVAAGAGGRFYVRALAGSVEDVWGSDGTTAGTQRLAALPLFVGTLAAGAGRAWFTHGRPPQDGFELWDSDGTVAGTRQRATMSVNHALYADPQGGAVWFGGSGAGAPGLWRADASRVDRVAPLFDEPPQSSHPYGLTALADRLVFAGDQGELWVSDGSGSGTHRLGPTGLASSLVRVGDEVFCFLQGPSAGLYKTDGTRAGTGRLAVFLDLPEAIEFDGRLLFVGFDATNAWALWQSDGTAAGTRLIKSIVQGFSSRAPRLLTEVDGVVFFAADDPGVLWKTDGTAAGTVQVAPAITVSEVAALTAVGDTLFFRGTGPSGGAELWKSNGTAVGTIRVKDIQPGNAGSSPTELSALGDTLVFLADDGVHGPEPWTSDGTAAGTALLRDLWLGAPGRVCGLTVAADTVFFSADDGVHGLELWRSDGTAGGTVLVRDLAPGRRDGVDDTPFFEGPRIRQLRAPFGSGAALVFRGLGPRGTDTEPWFSDGTAAGTVPLGNLAPHSGSWPESFTRVGDRLFFVAWDPQHGTELWAARISPLASVAEPFGHGCWGSAGIPELASESLPMLGNPAWISRISNARASAAAALFLGTDRVAVQVGECALYVGGLSVTLPLATDAAGEARITLPIPADRALLGAQLFAQGAIANPNGALLGLASLTNGLEIVVGR